MFSKPCGKCGAVKDASAFSRDSKRKDGLRFWCKECQREYMTAWRANNPDLIAWGRDRRVESGRAARDTANYRKRRPEKIAAYESIHNARRRHPRKPPLSPEARRKRKRETTKLWRKNNPLNVKVWSHRNRAKRLAAHGSHTRKELAELLLKQGNRCAVCGCSLSKGCEADHIRPIARGGSNDISNIQMLCRPCNRHKQAQSPIKFMQSRGFLL